MATRVLSRSLLTTKQAFSSALFRSYTTISPSSISSHSSSFSVFRLRPLVAIASNVHHFSPASTVTRAFSTRPTTSSLNDSSPNWSNRPPKETILLDGCDFEHWLVVMEKPEGDPTRDEIIDSYIKTLAMVIGNEEEARFKIYSVSTRHYFAFGALVSEELSYKLKELPKVRWVLPDSYLDVRNKDYGGEPFINGQAVPYDPKYHEEWVRNNARANERNRRNDRPRNFDRSRNFERRRETMQQNRMGGQHPPPPPPPMGGQQPPPVGGQQPPPMAGQQPYMSGPPHSPPYNVGQPHPYNHTGGQPQSPHHMAGPPPSNNFRGPPQPNNMGGPQHPNMGSMQQQQQQLQQQQQQQQQQQPNYVRGNVMPPNNGGQRSNFMGPPNDMGRMPNNGPNFQQTNGPSNGGMNYQSGPVPNGGYPNNNYTPNAPGGDFIQNQDMPGRDMPATGNF